MSSNIPLECECCHVYTSTWKNWETHVLCEQHFKEATANPDRFRNYFAYVNRGKQAKKSPQEAASPYKVLPVEALLTMPFVRRKDVEGADFEDLVQSVKDIGVLEPIIVRPRTNGRFEVVVGDRRHAAAKKAKLVEIPAIVKALSDEEAYGIRIVENVQRKDLSDMEKADWLSFMIKTFGYTQQQLAQKLGKTQQWVSQHLSMLRIPENITRVINSGEITEKQAREILSAPEEKREAIVNEINKTGEVPSAREIHELAHPEEKPKSVRCDFCGAPVETPRHLDGKFYHEECVAPARARESFKPENQPGLIPEGSGGSLENKEPTEKLPGIEKPARPEPLLTGYPWTCPDCGAKLIINHVDYPNSDRKEHRLEACG